MSEYLSSGQTYSNKALPWVGEGTLKRREGASEGVGLYFASFGYCILVWYIAFSRSMSTCLATAMS
jgi:hypothetical protein